jgi:hypothetical protein
MATQNRYPLVTRLNEAERYSLMALCQFWGKDEKQIVKFALARLEEATHSLSAKIQREIEDDQRIEQARGDSQDGGGDGAGREHAAERREDEKASS